MLIALFTLLFLGGGGNSYVLGQIDVLTGNVKAVVQADDRRKQAVELLKELEDDAKDYQKRQKKHAEDLEKLTESRTFDAAAVDAIWEAMFRDMESFHTLALSRRQELKSVVNRNEWSRVFAPVTKD